MKELRNFLQNTIGLQARFAANRMQEALPKMIAGLSPTEAKLLRARFDKVAAQPNGIYALLDYVNFKGEGVKPTERYRGEGWGLLQVLQNMTDSPNVMSDFATSARMVLERRVRNSPPQRRESRWLTGWMNRIRTYAQ